MFRMLPSLKLPNPITAPWPPAADGRAACKPPAGICAIGVLVLLLCALPALATAQTEGMTSVDLAAVLDPGTPNPVDGGETVTWLARVDNVFKTSVNASGVISVDIVASSSAGSFSFSASGTNWACTTSTCIYNAPLTAGSSTTDLVITGLAPFAPQGGTMSLGITASVSPGQFNDTNPTNNSASDEVQIRPEMIGFPDYVIASFSGSPNPVDPGAQTTFSLVVENDDAGPNSTEGNFGSPLSVDFSLTSSPAGASLGSISGTNWSCGSSSCVYGLQLGPGEQAPPLTIPVTAPPGGPGSITLNALLGGDKNQSNNAGQATVSVNSPLAPVDYRFQSISGAPDPVAPGASGEFELIVEEVGPNPNDPSGGASRGLPPLTVSFSLASTPGGASLQGVPSGTDWTCGSSSCTYAGSIGPGFPTSVLSIPIQAPPSGPGSITLSAQISGDDVPGNNQGSATIGVLGEVLDLVFAEFSGNPATVPAGAEIEYLVSVTALDGGGGKGVDGGPAGQGFAYDLSASSGSAQLLGTPTGTNWSCGSGICQYLQPLNPGQTTPLVRFLVQAPAQAPSTVTLAGQIFGDENSSNNQGSATVEVINEPPPDPPELTLDKQGPAQVEAGESFDYVLEVANVGNSPASQLRLFDRLPAGVTLIGVTPGGGWNCVASTTTVDCTLGFLAIGQTTRVTLNARIDAPGDYLNEALLEAFLQSGTITDSLLTRVVGEPPDPRVDLRLRKTDSVDPVAVGAAFAYDIEVTNLSNTPATAVTVVDQLPAGLQLVSAGGAGWSCSGSVVCVLEEALIGGTTRSLRIEVIAPAEPGVILNEATVSSAEDDLNPLDNTDSEQTTITSAGGVAVADLALSPGSPVQTEVGQEFELAAELRNLGPDQAIGIVLRGTISGPVTVLGAMLGNESCSVAGTQLSCFASLLDPDQSRGLLIRARADAIGSGNIQLQVEADTIDPLETNNNATLVYSIEASGADLAVQASANPDPVASGDLLNYRFVVSNNGPASADQALLSVNLGPGQLIESNSGAGLNCTVGGNLLSCSPVAALAVGASLELLIGARVQAEPGSTVVATANVQGSDDPNLANNNAEVSTSVGNRDEADIRDRLGAAAGADPTAGSAVGPLAELCANPPPSQVDFCNRLLQASDGEVREVLTATAPEETLSQSVLAREVSFAQFFNIDARLAELRGAAGGFSSAGLMLSGSGGALSLGNLLAGEDADQAGGLFGSPWGFFINGTISSGEQRGNAQRGQVGVDFESRGLTAGVDYRFSNALTAGVALGYADFDAGITGDSSIDTKALLLTGYASWYPTERLYLDGRLSLGRIDFEQARRIRFTLDGQTTDLLARGSADADQFSIAAGLGYHYNYGAWNLTPNASVRYSDTSVDGFTERGADPFNLRFEGTDTDSLLFAAGVQVSRAISTTRGVLTPNLSLSFNHESQDEDLTVIARFADGGTQPFRLENPATDSTYGALGLGMVYVGPNGVQAYLNYRTVFGYDDFSRDTINLGARFEF